MATGGRDDSRTVNGVFNIGTAVPNRIFVGGISSKTNEDDLRSLFSEYGNVKATKIIVDKAGNSKGYGFVTFETEEEAQKVLKIKGDCFYLKERKLNVAAAFKKHPYSRNLESGSIHAAPVVWSSHPYSNSTGFPNREPLYYPQASWPLLWHQQLYLPQCSYPPTPQSGYPQYVYSVAPPEYPYSTGPVAGSDYSETSSADSGDSGKNRSRASTPAPATTEYDRNRSTGKTYAQNVCVPKYTTSSNCDSPSTYVHSGLVPQMHHVLAKTVNGLAVMAYPAPFVMGNPAIIHMKDNAESEAMLSDIGYLHSSIASGALTPPPTPMAPLSCDFSVNTNMEPVRKS